MLVFFSDDSFFSNMVKRWIQVMFVEIFYNKFSKNFFCDVSIYAYSLSNILELIKSHEGSRWSIFLLWIYPLKSFSCAWNYVSMHWLIFKTKDKYLICNRKYWVYIGLEIMNQKISLLFCHWLLYSYIDQNIGVVFYPVADFYDHLREL